MEFPLPSLTEFLQLVSQTTHPVRQLAAGDLGMGSICTCTGLQLTAFFCSTFLLNGDQTVLDFAHHEIGMIMGTNAFLLLKK